MPSTTTISRISRDTVLYIPVFLAPALINILLLMMFTRFFSPKEYGTYTIVINLTIIAGSLLAQWVVLAVQRFRPEYQGQIVAFNRNLNQLLLYLSIGFLIGAAIGYLFVPDAIHHYYWPSVFLVVTSLYFMVLSAVYQADLKAKNLRNLNVFQSVSRFGIIMILVMILPVGPAGFIWGTVIAQLVVLAPMLRYVKAQKVFLGIPAASRFSDFSRKFWKYGFPLIGWYIGTTVLNLTDRFLLEYFRTSDEVGIYSANFTIAVQAIALLCNPLYFAAQPLMMKEVQEQRDQAWMEKRILHFTTLFIMVAVPLAVYFSIFRVEVSEILLGEKFTSGAVVIPVLILGFFAWNLGLYGQLTYQIAERTKSMFYFVTAAAVCNVVLNLFLIPSWGLMGAAVSTTTGFIVYSLLLYRYSHRSIKWEIPWKILVLVTLFSLLAAVPLIVLKNQWLADWHPLFKMMAGLPYFLVYFIFQKRKVLGIVIKKLVTYYLPIILFSVLIGVMVTLIPAGVSPGFLIGGLLLLPIILYLAWVHRGAFALFVLFASFGIMNTDIKLFDLLFVGMAVLFFFVKKGTLKALREIGFINTGIWVFLVVSLLSLFSSKNTSLGISYFIHTLFVISIFYFMIITTRTEKEFRCVMNGYMITVVISVAGVISEKWLGLGVWGTWFQGVRAQGFFIDPNDFAPFLILAIILALDKAFSYHYFSPRYFGFILLAGVITAVQLAAMSRAAILNLGIVLLVFFFYKRKLGQTIMLVLLTVPVTAFLNILAGDTIRHYLTLRFWGGAQLLQHYDQDRFFFQEQGISLGSSHLFGIGPGQFEYYFGYATHSLFIRIIAENGWIAFLLFSAVLIYLFILLVRFRKRKVWNLPVYLFLAVYTGLLVNSLFLDTLHWRYLWFFLGLCVIVIKQAVKPDPKRE
nr:lipopolysaccharide biosynthesis protein [Neobacillus sp. Marseille-Q6967]